MAEFKKPSTDEEFKQLVEDIRSGEGYKDPAAFAFGLATIEKDPKTGENRVIEANLTRRNYGARPGTAVVMAAVLGQEQEGLATGEYFIGGDISRQALSFFTPYNPLSAGQKQMEALRANHPNIHTLELLERATRERHVPKTLTVGLRNEQVPILAVVRDWDDEPQSIGDAMLRLYAKSEIGERSTSFKSEAIDEIMPVVVTTEQHGVFTPARWAEVNERIALAGLSTAVRRIGNIPDKLDYLAQEAPVVQGYIRPLLGE